MSDARLRALERDLAANPTPTARDRLAAERSRRGDGPWLPALASYIRHIDVTMRVALLAGRGAFVEIEDLIRAWTNEGGEVFVRPSSLTITGRLGAEFEFVNPGFVAVPLGEIAIEDL